MTLALKEDARVLVPVVLEPVVLVPEPPVVVLEPVVLVPEPPVVVLVPVVLVPVLELESATQSLLEVEPVALAVFVSVGQFVHCAFPVALLYLPAMQAVAAPPSRPLYPAGATQEAIAVEPDALPVFEFVGQFVHCAFPVSALNVSTSQAEQLPSGPVYPTGHGASTLQSAAEVEPVLLVVLPVEHAEAAAPLAP